MRRRHRCPPPPSRSWRWDRDSRWASPMNRASAGSWCFQPGGSAQALPADALWRDDQVSVLLRNDTYVGATGGPTTDLSSRCSERLPIDHAQAIAAVAATNCLVGRVRDRSEHWVCQWLSLLVLITTRVGRRTDGRRRATGQVLVALSAEVWHRQTLASTVRRCSPISPRPWSPYGRLSPPRLGGKRRTDAARPPCHRVRAPTRCWTHGSSVPAAGAVGAAQEVLLGP